MLSNFLDGPLRHLATAVIVVLGLLVLLAPPISLLDRLDLSALGQGGSSQIEANVGGMVQEESRAAVIFLPEDVETDLSFRFRSIAPTSFGALRGGDSAYQEGLDSLGASGLAPLGSFHVLDGTEFKSGQKVTIRAPLPTDLSELARMKIVTWQEDHWITLPSLPNMTDLVLEAELPSVPTNFLLVRDIAPGFASVTMLLTGTQLPVPRESDGAADFASAGYSRLRGDGALEGEIGTIDPAGLPLFLGVTNTDQDGTLRPDLLINMLSSDGQKDNQLTTITEAVNVHQFAGVYLQYFGLNMQPNAGPWFTEFAQSLGDTLRAQGKQLVIGLETPVQVSDYAWDTRGYDWASLSDAADILVVPAPIDPFAYRPGNYPFESLLQFATNRIARQKLAIQLRVHPVAVDGNEYRVLGYDDAVALMLGEVEVQSSAGSLLMRMNRDHLDPIPTYDPDLFQYRFGYADRNLGPQLVHVADATSLRSQLHTLQKYNIRQVVVDLTSTLDVDPQIWTALTEFHVPSDGLPPAASDYKVEYDIFRGSELKGDLSSGFIETDRRFPLTETGQFKVSADLSVNGILPGIRSESSVTVVSLTTDSPSEPDTGTDVAAAPSTSTPSVAAPSTPPVSVPSGPYLIPREALAAKSQPSNSAGTSQTLVIGETYVIVGRDSNSTWLHLEDSDQIVGWVSAIDASNYLYNNALISSLPVTAQPQVPAVSSSGTAGDLWGYGVQAHLLGTDVNKAMLATQTMNFNWMKQQIRWKDMQPSRGRDSIKWSEMNTVIQTAESRGIKMLFSVLAAPDWAREPGFDGEVVGPPANYADYADFVGALAKEYCGQSLKAIEIWNEQNLYYEWGSLPLDAAQYVALLREASAAIKRECPTMLVVSGALTPTGTNLTPTSKGGTRAVDDLEYLRRMLQAGMLNYVDAVGAHPSGYNVPPSYTKANYCSVLPTTGNSFGSGCPNNPHRSFSFRSTMEEYRAEIVKYNPRIPIWPTEFGWAVNSSGTDHDGYAYARDNDYTEQAQWTREAYVMMKDWGWVAAPILWNLNFRVIAQGTEREQWGIVDRNWNPLPVYDELKKLAAAEGR